MSSMTLAQQIITIGMCILGTMATRYLPFFIFKENKKTPEYIQYHCRNHKGIRSEENQ